MKHLRVFENVREYNRNDYVVLIIESEDSMKFNYSIGDICRIETVDVNDDDFPYELDNITNHDNDGYLWVASYQIRKAEDWEIEQNKYNL